MADPRQWTLVIPAPVEWISANERLHWRVKAHRTREWRRSAHFRAVAAGLPRGLDRVEIRGHVRRTDLRPYDPANLHPTLKAVIDGMVGDHGLCPDDSHHHVVDGGMHHGQPIRRQASLVGQPAWVGSQLVVTITEMEAPVEVAGWPA